jgi:hypothetical protein
MMGAYNLSTWEAEAGGLGVWAHPGLHNVDLVSKKKKKFSTGFSKLIYFFFYPLDGAQIFPF